MVIITTRSGAWWRERRKKEGQGANKTPEKQEKSAGSRGKVRHGKARGGNEKGTTGGRGPNIRRREA